MLRSKYQCEHLSFGDRELENNKGLGKLLFELASESRLAILRELQKDNLKMQEIARRLDVTAIQAMTRRLSTGLKNCLFITGKKESEFSAFKLVEVDQHEREVIGGY
jgi:hypothetical protein